MQFSQLTSNLSVTAQRRMLCRASLVLSTVVLLSACTGSRVYLEQPAAASPAIEVPAVSSTTATSKIPITSAIAPPTQQACASLIPLKQRVGQLMFPLLIQSEFELATELVSRGMLGGVVVLGSPDSSIRDDIALFQKQSLFGPAIVAVDEEGGRVQRLSKLTSKSA